MLDVLKITDGNTMRKAKAMHKLARGVTQEVKVKLGQWWGDVLRGSYAVDILQKQKPYLHSLPSGIRRSGRARVCNAQLDRVRRLGKQKTALEEAGEVRRWSRPSSEEDGSHWPVRVST